MEKTEQESKNSGLELLGYDEWFRNAGAGLIQDDFFLARIVEVNKSNFRAADGSREMLAELSGKFMFTAKDRTDFPTVGDWVVTQALDDHSLAIIHAVLPRKTLIKRKEPGRNVAFQLIAANIDYGLVMQSVDALNRNSLDRYLVMLNESGIQPIIVASKTDLLSESEAAEMQCRIDGLNTKHVFISALSDQGIEALSRVLEPRKTYCLLGPSGVGKTTLLNRLIGEDLLPVNEVRQSDGRGRHTTVRRQLVRLESGSIFIDTPGMRELGNFDVAAGIEQTFEDISRYAGNCRFRDCTHVHEKGCAVIDAVDRGEIAAERYRNFLKLKKEAAFYEMSYAQRRKKDRAFGKMIKSYKRMKRKPD